MHTSVEAITPDERRAYRVSDFCRAYGLGRTKVYELIKSGVLSSVSVGGRRLIPREAAEALIKQGAPNDRAA
jgi:excisionase family DNA binding protein